jgi:hypothetical protein
VRTALLPHLEPFVSHTLLPALGDAAGPAAAPADDAGAAAAAAAERELRRREARRLFGALAEAAGAAMYDRLIGLLADRLPEHIVLRRGPQPGGGQGWDELDRQAALMAKARVLVRQRPIRVRLEVDQQQQQQHQQQQQQQQGRPVALVIEEVGLQSVADVLRRDAEGGGGGDLEALLRRQAPPPARHQQPRGGAGRAAAGGRAAAPQLSVAEVLADAWQEDSDVNAQLGALVHLFGEALLAQLPLGELPSYVM